jgi:hypothetical protein
MLTTKGQIYKVFFVSPATRKELKNHKLAYLIGLKPHPYSLNWCIECYKTTSISVYNTTPRRIALAKLYCVIKKNSKIPEDVSIY